jgi:hypothetical protein
VLSVIFRVFLKVGNNDGKVPETIYIGLLGSKGCPSFDVVAHTYTGGNCTELLNYAEADATLHATEMELEHYTHGSCSPGGYTDFYLNLSKSHADDNIIFEVEQLGDNSDPRALTIYLFPTAIPSDRQSERRSEIASEGIYSVAMSSLDVEPGLYFLSVKCKDAGLSDSGGGGGDRIRFRVAPLAIHRDLSLEQPQHGELCPGEWIHHRFAMNKTSLMAVMDDESSEHRRLSNHMVYHARIALWKYSGDFYALASDHAPFKLMAPYSYMEINEHELVIDVCNIQGDDQIWVGLRGGAVCSVYDIEVSVHTSDCTPIGHERRLSTSPSSSSSGSDASSSDDDDVDLAAMISATGVEELVSNRLRLSRCEANGWVDFYLKVEVNGSGNNGVDPSENNIIFEVLLDASSTSNPEAVSVYLHLDGTLPDNRADSELFALKSVDGTVSLAVPTSMIQVDAKAVFLSVRCGASAVRFKTVALVLPAELFKSKLSFGEVCPGNWMHFTSVVPEDMSAGSHVRFDVTKYEGAASFIGRGGDRPLRLTYPYVVTASLGVEETTSIYVCNLEPGEKAYLGVKGGSHCASFSITPHFYDISDDTHDDGSGGCSEEVNAVATIQGQEDETIEFLDGNYLYGHCDGDGWAKRSFQKTITPDTEPTNLLIEVDMLDDDQFPGVLDAQAISVYMFSSPTPPALSEREGSYAAKSESAISNVHAISANYIAMTKAVRSLSLNNATASGTSIAVKCSGSRGRVRFRVLLHTLHAGLSLGHRYHSQVCPLGWVYHYVDLRSEESEAHRRQRRLGDVTGSEGTSGSELNLRIRLRILQGAIYQVSTRRDFPPAFNSNNLMNLELTAGDHPDSTVAYGKVVEFEIRLCGASGHKNYIGVFGDESGCAFYDVLAEYMDADEPCEEGATRVVEV